ncbi:MAG: hypothetical protein Q9170_003709 [Blastenia crenularia]
MDPILHGLNSGQLAAVTSHADVLQILAPPGSGKTKTLTSRVAYLIEHHGYKPWNILCLTFTIKSSREMKERLAKLLGNGTEAKLVLGTFHSVCRRYLVTYGQLIGISKGFGIADSSDSLSIIKRIVKRMHCNIDAKVAQSRISSSKSKGIGYADFSIDTNKKKNIDQHEFTQVFEAYENQLEQANLLDYDDLLLRCSELLRQHPLCVSNVEAVLIDEFQDTNVVQFELMKLFATQQKRITTVGDPDQSIYGWRSAEIKNLAKMKREYSDTLVIHLEDNYRSSGAILLAAQEVIEQDVSRPSKSLLPTHCPGTSPVLRRLPSSDVEASWIVSEIKRTIGLTGGMLKHLDFVILLRSAALSRHIESAMGKAGIPYRMVGGQRFFDRAEIKILLDYLRVISQPTNNDAVARVLNIPARGVGPTTVKALLEEAESKTLTLWSLVRDAVQGNIKTSTKIKKPAEQGLGAFINIILTAKRKLRDPLDPLSPQSLLQHIISKLNFQEYLKRNYEIDHEGRWANVEELIAQAADYAIPLVSGHESIAEADQRALPVVEGATQSQEDTGEEMLSMFLANVALATELQRDEESEEDQSRGQVTISTIHAAKGLEWPVVFIPAAYEGSIPHSRAEDTDEERRLLYVAMTRAQALLYISCPVKNSQREESTLSQFLDPKTVGHYLAKSGTKLDSGVVSDIAHILRRQCPSESEIRKGSSALQTKEDDLWPLDGQQLPELMKSKWDNQDSSTTLDGGRQETQKSRLWCDRDSLSTHQYPAASIVPGSTVIIGNNITMDDRSSFSVQSLGGFTSATNQFHRHVQEQQLAQKPRQASTARRDASTDNQTVANSRKRKFYDRAQSNLTSLWGAPAQPTGMMKPFEASYAKRMASSAIIESHFGSAKTASSNLDNIASISIQARSSSERCKKESIVPRIPLAPVPVNLAKQKIRPIATVSTQRSPYKGHDEPDDRYVFLSSSPLSLGTTFKRESDAARSISQTSTDIVASHEAETSAFGDLRPAAIRHVTSIAQVQSAAASRKTLGVRRSMNGWNAKGVPGFSVPKKVSKP